MRLRSFHFSIFVTLALLSCAEHAPVVDKHPVAPMPAPIAPADGGTPQTVALLEPMDAGVDAGIEKPVATQQPSIDPSAWLETRDVSSADRARLAEAFNCEELGIEQREIALVCTTTETVGRKNAKFPMDRVLEHRTVNVVRAKKLVKVLDVIVTLEALDKETEANIVDLGLHFSGDGSVAKLDERTEFPGTRCAEAREENHKELKEGGLVVDWAVFDRDLIARVCGSIGEFEWKKDRFARRVFTDALPIGAAKPNSGYGTGGF